MRRRIVTVALFVLAGCGDGPPAPEVEAITDVNAAAMDAMAAADAALLNASTAMDSPQGIQPVGGGTSAWDYSVTRDEARNADIKSASILSSNEVYLSPPYNGGSRMRMTVRQHPQYGLDLVFVVSPSQILCPAYEGCAGLINVDGNPERLSLNASADYDSEVVFAQYPEAILDKLEGSEKVIIELPFYSNGNRQFTFDTRGLEWPIES